MRTHLPLLLMALIFGLATANGCGSVSSGDDGGTGKAGGTGSAGSSTGSAGSGTGSAGSGTGSAGSGTGGPGTAGTGGSNTGHAGTSGGGGTGNAGSSGDGGVAGKGGAGSSGHNGDGGQTCSDLQAQYASALVAARSCDVKAAGQCSHLVSSSLSPCFLNCMTNVNDAAALNELKAKWTQAGCNSVPVACPAIACLQPTGNMCAAADGGGGTCVSSNGLPRT
jgi:hypothetical protein